MDYQSEIIIIHLVTNTVVEEVSKISKNHQKSVLYLSNSCYLYIKAYGGTGIKMNNHIQ